VDTRAQTPLIAVVGPTGSGKSELALRLAEQFAGEIVNCDSVQIYRHFNIGTAKPAPAERRGVPHHLIDILEPEELFTAGDYARRARSVIGEIVARGRLPILAGGTGFYLRALLDGLAPGPERDAALRERLMLREQRRPGILHRMLTRFDRPLAARIHPNDVHKTLRALELRILERRPASEIFAQGRTPLAGFRVIKLGLQPSRAALYDRINQRVVAMFAAGLAEETRAILSSGARPDAKPFASLGYKQALQVLTGAMSLEQAVASAQIETRHYAKRQITWFRREAGIHWLAGFGDDPAIGAEAADVVKLNSEEPQ
jgi:tRNA dimethylallyltransferase